MKSSNVISVLIWSVLLALLVWMIDGVRNPNKAEVIGKGNIVVLERDPSGHYRAEAFINDTKVNVLVDTGATGVAISQKLADELGIVSNTAIRTNTANGVTLGYMVRLKSVKLGGIEVQDVAATIAPGLQGEALLGMSFLSRMDIRLYKGRMTITPAE
jgi:aspartyl protease family protein